ncbi:MAG: VWA domain-containing protein [Bryobacteraceae bacterium]
MSDFVRFMLFSAAGIALSGAGFAQAQTEPAGQTADNVVIKSSVREVLLDVVVRNKHGKPVTDLKPEQMAVYEDGVRQNVRSFRLVKGGEVRIEDEKEAAEVKAATGTAAKSTAGPKLNPLNPLRTVNLVCLVFSGLNAETRALAQQAAREFVNNELRPNTFIGVFGLDDAGLKPLSPFSNDREHLLKAVDLAAMNQLRPLAGSTTAGVGAALSSLSLGLSLGGPGGLNTSELARELVNTAGEVRSGAAGPLADATNPLGPRGSMEFDNQGGMRDLDALRSLVRQLSLAPYQKTVLLLSTGLTRPPDEMGYWRSLIRSANQGGVTFYGLDMYGLNVCQDDLSAGCTTSHSELQQSVDVLDKSATLSTQQAEIPNSNPRSTVLPADIKELMHQDDYVRNSVLSANKQAGLRDLAESTGGFLIANTNNTEQLLKHVMEDVDTHYEVTYQPAANGYDGRFRKIEVKLSRTDLQARTRSGYFSLPEAHGNSLGAGDMAGLRALNAKPLPHAFDFQSQALRFRSENGTSQYAVVFNVPIANLTATAEPEAKKHRFHASLLALARNSQGQVEDWFSRDVPSDVADRYVPSLETRHMTYERSFRLPPGRYTIETAVVDEEGNRASTNVMQIDNVAPNGPELSDIMLAQKVEELERSADESDPFESAGRRVIPLATADLPAGSNPLLYFVLYPQKDNPDKTVLRVRFLRDGRQIANRTVAIGEPDSSGGVPMLISAVQKPGNYEVHVAMTQGRAAAERSLTYSIAGN